MTGSRRDRNGTRPGWPAAAPLVLAVALIVPVLAGCVAGPSESQGSPDDGDAPTDREDLAAHHHLDRVEPFSVETDDGVVLRGDVYLPNGSGPFATMLSYAPYWNGAFYGDSEDQASDDGESMQGSYGRFLEAGFAVALVNIRGTGESDGCNPWMDFEADGADAYHVIEALANASWSNGKVGMTGISWPGYTQYAALADDPPSLKAVAPASAVLDAWTLFTRRGPTIISQFGPMASTYAAFQVGVAGYPGQFPANRAECPEHVDQIRAFNQLTTDGDRTEWWEKRTAHEIIADTETPMFVTNGMTKLSEGHILQVDGLWPLMPDESRLVIGQWGHAYPDDDRSEWYWDTLIAWFDHYLRDGPKRVETGFVEYQDNEDQWYRSDTWPPEANRTRLHLSDGTIVDDPDDATASTQSFVTGDADPRPDDCTANKALYVSPPLAEDALLAGNFGTNVTVTSTAPNTNFGVFVWHVDEVDVCPAADRHSNAITYPDEVSRALSDLRHRGHLEQGEPFPVGEPGLMSLRSHPFATRVKAGERLVVGVTGGAVELSAKDPDAGLRIHTGSDTEAWIELPVVEGELVFEGGGEALPAS